MNLVHPLPPASANILSPRRFPFPFTGEAHPLCRMAVDETMAFVQGDTRLWDEARQGKMFGVLVVEKGDERGFLAAFSGTLCGQTRLDGFVPPVYDLMQPGCYFQEEQQAISNINARVRQLDALITQREHDPNLPLTRQRADLVAFEREVREAKRRREQVREQLANTCEQFANKNVSSGAACELFVNSCEVGVKPCEVFVKSCEAGVNSCEVDVKSCELFVNSCEVDVKSCELFVNCCESSQTQFTSDEMGKNEADLIRESQFMKAELRRRRKALAAAEEEEKRYPLRLERQKLVDERARRSAALQSWLFRQFVFLNARGEECNLLEIFRDAVPPGGAGDCCAPKLLQYAYRHQLRPICLAEFWVGESPRGELREHGKCYAPCRSRCHPILGHMLQGLDVADSPLQATYEQQASALHEVARQGDILVVSKPAGLRSVPGLDDDAPSVCSIVRARYPDATGPLIAHRLDMDTSGLMLVALTDAAYHRLQDLFLCHGIRKTYTALLEHPMPVGEEGDIHLPLRPDYDDRPRQMVDEKHGKSAHTHYRVLGNEGGHARVELMPLTGRTHQLRVHCAHPQGLNNPIVGDRLYGTPAQRLMLHACKLQFHPLAPLHNATGECTELGVFEDAPPF